jgi:hypothetical protein
MWRTPRVPPENQSSDPCHDPADWGWALVQRDWGLRQDEPAQPTHVIARIGAKIGAKIEELAVRGWRGMRVALRGIVHGGAR